MTLEASEPTESSHNRASGLSLGMQQTIAAHDGAATVV
jgi:hypothetical protein